VTERQFDVPAQTGQGRESFVGAARKFSTDGLPESDRLNFWNAGSVAIGGVEADQIEDEPFHGSVVQRMLGDAKVFHLDTSPHRAAWTRRLIERSEDPHLRLCFQEAGTTIISVDGTDTIVRAGEWFVTDSRRPFTSNHYEPARKIALQIPFGRLAAGECAVVRKLSGGVAIKGGVAQMLRSCLQTALEDMADVDDRLDHDLGETMIDLLRLMLREHGLTLGATAMRDLTQERIRAFVRRNLRNSALSVEMIAQAMKCSKRYVHKVFSGDQTVSEYIWAERLDQCRNILSAADQSHITLTQVAFENGFSSSAHFSRAFREKFGKPPRVFRAEMMEAGSRRDKTRAHGATSSVR
jgi:AraC-like DNA-binding protein